MEYVVYGRHMHLRHLLDKSKDDLLSNAKGFGITKLSRLNKRQLAEKILQYLIIHNNEFYNIS